MLLIRSNFSKSPHAIQGYVHGYGKVLWPWVTTRHCPQCHSILPNACNTNALLFSFNNYIPLFSKCVALNGFCMPMSHKTQLHSCLRPCELIRSIIPLYLEPNRYETYAARNWKQQYLAPPPPPSHWDPRSPRSDKMLTNRRRA